MSSTTKRIISGSAASWARILVTLFTQLALVPIFLTYWDVKTFGIWLAIQALIAVLGTLDKGYNDFLQFEFLKLGVHERKAISSMLWSGVFTTIIVGLLEMVIIYFLGFHFDIGSLFNETKVESTNLQSQIGWALTLQWIAWAFNNLAGLFFRSLSVFGYFPRMGWWEVIKAIITAFVSCIAVANGADLTTASAYFLIGNLAIVIFQSFDIKNLLNKEQLLFNDFSLIAGFKYYSTSLGLSGRYFLENFRQQGVRLLIAPLSGSVGLTAFTTMRTGANVALQGLGTVINPIMPELMRFLQQRDKDKTNAIFDTIWLVLIVGLVPVVIVVQAVIPSLFAVWTKSQIEFDPLLFATLSLSVLVYAWSQPAAAVVTGNNLLKAQLTISIISSIAIIGGMFILIPAINILGAGISLLVGEIIAAIGFQYAAKKWLYSESLEWPARSAQLAAASVVLTAGCMFLMIVFPDYLWQVFCLTALLLTWNLLVYWRNISPFAREKAYIILGRLPLVGKLTKSLSSKTQNV